MCAIVTTLDFAGQHFASEGGSSASESAAAIAARPGALF
jgi:hypothetical protein